MVGEAGIEPTTPGLEGRCSIRLSYSPDFCSRGICSAERQKAALRRSNRLQITIISSTLPCESPMPGTLEIATKKRETEYFRLPGYSICDVQTLR